MWLKARSNSLVAREVDKYLLASKVAVFVAIEDEIHEGVEATHDLCQSARRRKRQRVL